MLLTICYSLLTWIQGRRRAQVGHWIEDAVLKQGYSILLIRNRTGSRSPGQVQKCLIASTPSLYSTSTLSQDLWPMSTLVTTLSLANLHLPPQAQVSPHCFHSEPKAIRLLWESPEAKALVISPHQIVELHDWTAWISKPSEDTVNKQRLIHLLIEAEPGLATDRRLYRKFCRFGALVAWKCDAEFAVILRSSLNEVTELMHIYRLAGLVLEGGWRVYRITTITVKGTAGTLISFKGLYSNVGSETGYTPGGLRRLSASIYESTDSPSSAGTPKSCLSKETSKYKIPLISEDSLDRDEEGSEDQVSSTIQPLLNWHQRSPRKQSSPSLSVFQPREKASFTLPRRKVNRSCSLSERSLSLASLLFCSEGKRKGTSRSVSVDEDAESFGEIESPVIENRFEPTNNQIPNPSDFEEQKLPVRRISVSTTAMDRCSSPSPNRIETKRKLSSSASGIAPGGHASRSTNRTPARRGKPPNILILCSDETMRQSIHTLLNTILPSDRYVIYEIRWDQVQVGGWADQTALLVLSGTIPDPAVNTPLILQFLGDGGHLLAWCADSAPFGIPRPAPPLTNSRKKERLVYGPSQAQTQELVLENGWGQTAALNGPPPNFPRVLEAVDSEGISRPLTTSVIGKSKDNGSAVILQLDGGALGGKAILSRVHFEEIADDALLSYLLNGALGLDCTRIKSPEYTPGYLLGDHKRILDFLAKTPPKVEQPELELEFVSRGEKGPPANHRLFPIHYFECPQHFSTLQYFENLNTRDLGRLVIYSDALSSVMNVLSGRPLQDGLTVVARQQTAGRGRGKNVWLSPEGSALFAFQIHVTRSQGIGQRLSLIQHLTALAIILAVPPHREIDLCVKWPNDVYLGGEKVGGILVESLMEGKNFVVNVGVGLNVSNSYPTTSLNAALSLGKGQRSSSDTDWSPFGVERLIAGTLTQLEGLLDMVDRPGGLDEIIRLYTSNWIHSAEEEVNVEVGKGNWATCQVESIDEFGFMRVREVATGNTLSVQPDGNSFDIANRLISIK